MHASRFWLPADRRADVNCWTWWTDLKSQDPSSTDSEVLLPLSALNFIPRYPVSGRSSLAKARDIAASSISAFPSLSFLLRTLSISGSLPLSPDRTGVIGAAGCRQECASSCLAATVETPVGLPKHSSQELESLPATLRLHPSARATLPDMSANHPTLINLPPPPSDPVTPSDMGP